MRMLKFAAEVDIPNTNFKTQEMSPCLIRKMAENMRGHLSLMRNELRLEIHAYHTKELELQQVSSKVSSLQINYKEPGLNLES